MSSKQQTTLAASSLSASTSSPFDQQSSSTTPTPPPTFPTMYQPIEKMEPDDDFDEYIKYFERVASINGWDDKTKAHCLAVNVPKKSPELAAIDGLSAEDQASFKKVLEAIKGTQKSKTHVYTEQLWFLKRKPMETLNELAIRTTDLVEKVYGNFAKSNKTLLVRDAFISALDPSLRSHVWAINDLPKDVHGVINGVQNQCSYKIFNNNQ